MLFRLLRFKMPKDWLFRMKTSNRANRFHVASACVAASALLSLSACSIVPKNNQFAATKLKSENAVNLSSAFSNKSAPTMRHAANFLPVGQTILAPIAFLEMCERAPSDCDHSGQADTTALVERARSVILMKLDRAFSANGIDPEMATAAIKAPSSLPSPMSDQMIPAYVSPPPSTYTGRTNLRRAIFPAYSEDISGSDFSIAAAALTDDLSDRSAPSEAFPPMVFAQPVLVNAVVNRVAVADRDAKTPSQPPIQKQGRADYLRINFDSQVKSLSQRINNLVNQTIVPDNDVRIYQASDFWNAPGMTPGTRGDCEDYALEKRRLLIENGIPAEALSLAIVKTSAGVEHVVLILSTIQGDLVLDNLLYNIKDWRKTGYTWISRQGTGDDLSWISLNEANTPSQVASVDNLLAINQ